MKICFIAESVFSIGGVQRVLSVIANELNKEHDVEILCPGGEVKINRELYGLDNNIKVNVESSLLKKGFLTKFNSKVMRELNEKSNLFNKNIFKNILNRAYYPKEIQEQFSQYINNKGYDIVIGVEGRYSILLGCISEKINAKTIGWLHNSYDAYLNTPNKYYYKQHALFKEYLPKLYKCLVLTKDDRNLYKNILNVDCQVMYNPLSFESKVKSLCNKKNIIFVGRLVKEQKGLDLLIKAFEIIKNKAPEWKLTIIGDGADKESLIKVIEEKGLTNSIRLIGATDNVLKYYLDSSIFVSSSRWEGFGLVITEAMECGVPVVAFNNSGPAEIINKNNINGVLVEQENYEELANSILYLINNSEDRIKMSKESIRRAKDFRIENIINKWNQLIN